MSDEPIPEPTAQAAASSGAVANRPRVRSIRIWHVLLWLVGLALVLAYSRGARRDTGIVLALLVTYAIATLLGLRTPRAAQRSLVILIALLPLVMEASFFGGDFLGRPEGLLQTSHVLVSATMVVGVPAWLALFVTVIIRGADQPRARRIAVFPGLLLLCLSWGLALVLLITHLLPALSRD